MRFPRKAFVPALVAAAALTLASCAPTGPDNSGADLAPVEVSIITSQTGPLAAYGAAYLGGFEAGLDFATGGTGTVDGREVNVTIQDDAGDVDKAVTLIKDVIGNGTQIVAGTVSSGIALALAEQAEQNNILYISGPAAADAITGINQNTFRSGRQSYQDVATAGTFIGDPDGKNILVFAQDTAFGQGNFAAATAVLGGQGAEVTSLLVPEDTTEFTGFAQQIVAAAPDLVFVAWAGATSAAMWESLTQQGVFDVAPVVTGLGDVSTYNAFGDASGEISFLNHYFAGAADNEVNTALIDALEADGAQADLFSPDGFNAAILLVQAIRAGGGDDVDEMIASLEGYTFEGPKGTITIRAEDHAVIQPMFQVKLVKDGADWVPELVETVDAETVAPPVAK